MEPKRKHRAKCEGCPLWQDGAGGVVPDHIRPDARVLVVGQNPGVDEEAAGEPFVGRTGQSLEQNFLVRAGLSRETVSLGNAIRCRWRGTNSLPPVDDARLRTAVEHCRRAWAAPNEAALVVACGDYAALAVAGITKPADWRGWLVPQWNAGHRRHLTEAWVPDANETPVLITVHPARLFRDPTLTPAAVRDWQKVRHFLAGRWPVALAEPYAEPIDVWPKDCAFDTEYDPNTGTLHRYSVSDGEHSWVVEAADHRQPIRLPEHVWMHNAVADLTFLRSLLMAEPRYDDTMLLHSVLASDLPHDLDYLGSLYAPLNRWKHLDKIKPRLYAAGDAVATWVIGQALSSQLAFDPGSEWVYRNSVLPLVPIIIRARQRGLRVNKPRVATVLGQVKERCDAAMWQARAATGIGSFNVGSPSQVAQWIYDIEM